MSIGALNAQIAMLNRLLKATPKNLKTVTDAFGDQHGGSDVLHYGGDSGDQLHYGGGSGFKTITDGGIQNVPGGGGLGVGLRGGLRAAARVAERAKAEISEHADKHIEKIDKHVDSAIDKLIKAFNLGDKALEETFRVIATKATWFTNGIAELSAVLNILNQWKAAQRSGDAYQMKLLLDLLYAELQTINNALLGPSSTRGQVDPGRLLSSFGQGKKPPPPPGTSTGFAP